MPEWTRDASACWRLWREFLVARHLKTADDLFGGPQGSPRTESLVACAVQWAERIMRKIDNVHP
jgi:hypothetical protein